MRRKMNSENSAFFRLILNNKFVTGLLVILLLLMVVYMLHAVRFMFQPIAAFMGAVGAPIVVAGVFYYLLNPTVDWAEKRFKMKRNLTITLEFVILTALIVWAGAVLVPIARDQIDSLVRHWPEYWANITDKLNQWTSDRRFKALNSWVKSTNSNLEGYVGNVASLLKNSGGSTISSVFSTITMIFITIATFPLILFYLLKDGHQLPGYMTQFLPVKARQSFIETITEINLQISNYIRGQLSVAFAVALMFGIGYMIIGLPYAWLIAVIAGFLNLIPFLGSFLAMIPAVVVGMFVSPMMLVYILIVFIIEQTLEGKVISPKLLGNSLKIHPVTVVIILLSAGNIFGVIGVIFGIPGYAIVKVLASRLYIWWKHNSNLFDDDETNDHITPVAPAPTDE